MTRISSSSRISAMIWRVATAGFGAGCPDLGGRDGRGGRGWVRRGLPVLGAVDREDFSKVHPCAAGSSDVVDEPEAKLVILSPDYPHSAKTDSSAGRQAAAEILNRGSAGRNCGNMLVFLAADKTRFVDLDKAVRY